MYTSHLGQLVKHKEDEDLPIEACEYTSKLYLYRKIERYSYVRDRKRTTACFAAGTAKATRESRRPTTFIQHQVGDSAQASGLGLNRNVVMSS